MSGGKWPKRSEGACMVDGFRPANPSQGIAHAGIGPQHSIIRLHRDDHADDPHTHEPDGTFLYPPGLGGGAPVAANLKLAARQTADWLDLAQSIYHGVVQGYPRESRDTCMAGMCGDYRAHRDLLRAALGEAS